MRLSNFKLLICSCICSSSCSIESNNLSAGVSLEGTGKPNLEGGSTPIPPSFTIEDTYSNAINEFILWSAGEQKADCQDLSIAMQLLHPVSWQPLTTEQGYPIIYGEASSKRLAGMMVNVTNNSNKSIDDVLEHCQPSVKVKDHSGNLIPVEMNFKCNVPHSIVKHPAGKTIQYNFVFALPDETALSNLIYIHKYAESRLDRDGADNGLLTCDIEYPLLLAQ